MWGLPILHPLQPCEDAVVVWLAQALDDPELVVLSGAIEGGAQGRYSVIGLPSRVEQLPVGEGVVATACRPSGNTLRVVVLGYELGATEVSLSAEAPPGGQPYGLAIDLDAAIVVDHQQSALLIVGSNAESGQRLHRAAALAKAARCSPTAIELEPAVSDLEHSRRINSVLDHIAAGDIYQANIARRLVVRGELRDAGALVALHQRNPVAHSALIRTRGVTIVSNSMETLLHLEGGRAQSLPIKGTRGEGENAAALLLADAKENAEHIMIVDLVRNDLGKIATPGGVSVPQLMAQRRYRGLIHLVSTVEAQLPSQIGSGEVVAALFPGGSITGAPKRRAMQIIRDIEAEPRGFYTGSIGLCTPDGRISLSILIRTLVCDNRGWSLAVGGGIVADSQPAREIEETWEKVAVFREVLGDRSP